MIGFLTRLLLCIAGALLYILGYFLIGGHDEYSGFWYTTSIGIVFIIGTVLMQAGL